MANLEGANPKPARLRVLIADDVQETRRSTRLMLTLIPSVEVVAMAHNGREAVEMTHIHQPDIALMDVNMPEMNGLQAIQTMLQQRPEMACIVVSAERDHKTLNQARVVGAHGYLIKPFTADQLVDVMQRASQIVMANRQRAAQFAQQRLAQLEVLANQYAQSRRSDEQAVLVFEELATHPDCSLRWLMTLAMMYVIRKEWHKLKLLAERLEQHPIKTTGRLRS